ncbi:hypothetical protein Tco_0634377, partial [Tanacetum coccineum]
KDADVVVNGNWAWPNSLTNEFNGLAIIDPPSITYGKPDKVLWKTDAGKHVIFSVSSVFDDLIIGDLLVP